MKKAIKINESDIRRMVTEAINEIGWQAPNDLYDTHRDSVYFLENMHYWLGRVIENCVDYPPSYIKYDDLEEPVLGQVNRMVAQIRKMSDWCYRKAEQIKGFEGASEEKFKQQNGQSMEDYFNGYHNEKDQLFHDYMNNRMDGSEYDAKQDELKGRYPDVDQIRRY